MERVIALSIKKRMALVLFFIVFSFLLSIRTIYFPLSQRIPFNDSSIYQYIGYIITKGGTPYLEVFDHKGIYFYFINALGYSINAHYGAWLLIWAGLFICIVFTFLISIKTLNTKESILITLITGSGISACFWDGDNPDFFAVPFVLIALFEMADYFNQGHLKGKKLLITGVSSGIAFWMKPNVIAGVLTIGFCLIVFELHERHFCIAARMILFFFIGFIAASLPGIIWIWSKGALFSMIEDYFLFNFKYVSFYNTLENQFLAFGHFLTRPSSYVALVFLLFYLVSRLSNKKKENKLIARMIICGVVSYLVCLVIASLAGNSYDQYSTILYPPTVYLLAGTIFGIKQNCLSKEQAISIITFFATCIVVCLNTITNIYYCNYFWKDIPQESDEIQYIIDNTEPGDTIAVLSPYYTGLYLATGRDSATKYVYIQLQHFLGMREQNENEVSFWKEYADAITVLKPSMIVWDKKYINIKNVNEILEGALVEYDSGGESERLKFYILSRDNRIIPPFYSDEVIEKNDSTIHIPSDVIDAYDKGKLTREEVIEIVLKEEKTDEISEN